MSITDKDIDTISENIDGVLFFAGEQTDQFIMGLCTQLIIVE